VCPDDWFQSSPDPTADTAAACGTGVYEETFQSGDEPYTDNDFGNYV
jgi:hypothetical protein